MPANWVIYIPRPRKEAELNDETGSASLVDQALKWETQVIAKGAGKKYAFTLICLDEPLPVALGKDDVVYVYGGHGLSNQDFVSWPGNTKNPIDSATMVERVAKVVPAGFQGRLKVYSCYSGDAGETAFASKVAAKLRAKNYECRVFGYTGQVTQTYEVLKGIVRTQMKMKFPDAAEGAFDGMHRWSVVGPVGKAMYQGRAKADRVPV